MERQKVYCGMKQELPPGYDRFALRYQCLKKGYGACLYAGRLGLGRRRRRRLRYGVVSALCLLLLAFFVLMYRYFRQ